MKIITNAIKQELLETIEVLDRNLDNTYEDFQATYSLTRENVMTITAKNFFISSDDTSIRNPQGFLRYFLSLTDFEANDLAEIFILMANNALLDVIADYNSEWITVFHYDEKDEPHLIEAPLNASFVHILNLYTTKQINCRVTVEELVKELLSNPNIQY